MSRLLPAYLFLLTMVPACGDNETTGSPDAAPPDAPGVDGPVEPPPPPPITRAHAGGNPGPVVVAGDHVVLGVGPRLVVRTRAGVAVGESAPLRGTIEAVAVIGTRAYVAERLDLDARIHIIDLTNPTAPVQTGELDLAGDAGFSVIPALVAGAGRLYVADQEQGVFELDVTSPDAPTVVRLVTDPGVRSLSLVGDRLYSWGSGFGGVSVTTRDVTAQLAVLGEASLPGAVGVAITTNHLAVVAGTDGIFVYDLTDPSAAVERFHVGDADQGPFARSLAASGTTAWIPASNGLHVLNLATPAAIAHTGPLAVPSVGVNAAAAGSGTLAYTTDRGQLVTLDVASPLAPGPAQATDVTLCADCTGVSAAGETLYVADIVGGLRTARLGDLATIGRSAALPGDPVSGLALVFEDVTVAGNRAYVADWLFGLRIYDVADPAAPVQLGALATGGFPAGVAVLGDRAYVAESTNVGALLVIDVANPAAPRALGRIETSKGMAVKVLGTVAYVADESNIGSGGLKLYDIANPAGISLLGTYDQDCLYPGDVAVAGAIAVVACSGDGFHFVDVTNPAAPARIAVVPAPGNTSAWAVATDGTRAFLGHDRGVLAVDLATRADQGSFATAWTVRALAAPAAGRVIAACGLGGVYQWQVD